MATAAQLIALPRGITLDDIPVKLETGRWWRQTDPKYEALSLPHVAKTSGRCHRKRQQPRLYASSTENAAWGELFRHVQAEVSPFEARRTMSEIQVANLPVVDFEDPVLQALFSVREGALVANDCAACRKLADLLRSRPDLFGGMILPSAAMPGERTLVVFSEWIPDHLEVVHRRTSTPPRRLLRLFETVVCTLRRQLRDSAQQLLLQAEHEVQAAAQKELKRLRRRSGA